MTDQTAWECDYCGDILYSPRNARHEVTIDGEKEDWCADCYILFYKARSFVQHIQDHIDHNEGGLNKSDKVICEICNKTIDEIFKDFEG